MQRLVWSILLEHEVVYAVIEYTFPHITTPLLQGLGSDGEAGHAFQRLHLGFVLQVEMEKKILMVKTTDRMAHMIRLLGKTAKLSRLVCSAYASFDTT